MLSEPTEPPIAGTLDHTDAVARTLLRRLMRDTGLSLAEVARAAELPLLVLAEWMTGRTQPSLGALIRVVEACGLRLRLHLDPGERYGVNVGRRLPQAQSAVPGSRRRAIESTSSSSPAATAITSS